MSVYVLIHGGWHANWCWGKVIPLLEKQGHKAVAPNLPGSGGSPVPVTGASLQIYTDSVCQILDSLDEPAILVGHSMSGAVISQAAESRPDKIKTLVYLCAFLMRDGEAVLQHTREDRESLVFPNVIRSEDQRTLSIKPEGARDVFYADCSEEDVQISVPRLESQAAAPLATPIHITEENYGRVPRIYITTTRDHAITPSAQQRMYTTMPCKQVISMDTGHSPFFAAPEKLVGYLLQA